MSLNSDVMGSWAKLASDYGPFLFAILFTLVVPVQAYANFQKSAIRFRSPTEYQRGLIQESRIYFRTTWIAGLVLIAFSVGWWLFLNWNTVRVSDEKYWMRFQGQIAGISADDVLGVPRESPMYTWLVDYPTPHYEYIVLTHSPPSVDRPVQLFWVSKSEAAGQASGFSTKYVKFLLDPDHTFYELNRNDMQIVPNK